MSMTASAVEVAPSTADFKSLEEKVLRTIELLKSARQAQAVAERDAARLREELNEREEELDTMRQELVTLWARSNDSREQLLVRLQDWCRRAEASDIAPLRQFSRRLRSYN